MNCGLNMRHLTKNLGKNLFAIRKLGNSQERAFKPSIKQIFLKKISRVRMAQQLERKPVYNSKLQKYYFKFYFAAMLMVIMNVSAWIYTYKRT